MMEALDYVMLAMVIILSLISYANWRYKKRLERIIEFDSELEPGNYIIAEQREDGDGFDIIEAKVVLDPEEEQELKEKLEKLEKTLTQSKLYFYSAVVLYIIVNLM